MYKTLLALIISATSSLGMVVSDNSQTTEKVLDVGKESAEYDYISSQIDLPEDFFTNPFNEFLGKKIPTLPWLLKIAKCETGVDWQNPGTFGGAFGFMHKSNSLDNNNLPNDSTWGRWGGFEYAKKPQKARSWQQVVVYIRIYVTGWTRADGYHKPPVGKGFQKNQCWDYVGQKVDWQILDSPYKMMNQLNLFNYYRINNPNMDITDIIAMIE